ncbi:MAG: DUF362 domain-containing protein [Acidobacteria bacterium]|nr:DUF362 domain-containing protein [Acidobacteriota bacterium]
MPIDRRELLAASLAAAAAACSNRLAENPQPAASADSGSKSKLGIPGPYPGRVVAVHHPGSYADDAYQAGPVGEMLDRGMMELTHAPSPVEAWREFFEPGDVVGIKLNPVGQPAVISDPSMFHAIIARLEAVGIPRKDIIAYDRYGEEFQRAGFVEWLPEGVRWTSGSPVSPKIQLDMGGYDEDIYMELPLIHPSYVGEYRIDDPHLRRSYVCKFLTKETNKVINLPILKHHQSAGVTLALKNLSHGFTNNVSRSHASTTANACGLFIPAAVDLPIFREKIVLNILDGIKGAYHGGPGTTVKHYAWAHKTLYFATDPVAMDKVGWKVIDEKRAEVGRASIALMKPDEHSRWLNGQVEHIELAGNFGLGVFDDDKIRLKRVDLG